MKSLLRRAYFAMLKRLGGAAVRNPRFIAAFAAPGTQEPIVREGFVLTRVTRFPLSRPRLDFSETPYDYVRIGSLQAVAARMLAVEVPGSVAEIGVFRGDFARHISAAFPDRTFYLFDTFDGFPDADMELDKRLAHRPFEQDFSGTSVEEVLARLPHPERCVVRKGYFPATAAGVDDRFAFVSVDVDLSKPIYDALVFCYPRLSHGGCIFVHDYDNHLYQGVKQSVDRYIDEHGVSAAFPLPDEGGTLVLQKAHGGRR